LTQTAQPLETALAASSENATEFKKLLMDQRYRLQHLLHLASIDAAFLACSRLAPATLQAQALV
jgi:hypothetical protein